MVLKPGDTLRAAVLHDHSIALLESECQKVGFIAINITTYPFVPVPTPVLLAAYDRAGARCVEVFFHQAIAV